MTRAAVLLALLFAVLAPAASACTKKVAYDPKVPTIQKVTGIAPGTRPVSDEKIERFLSAVDAASSRVRTVKSATSAGGRPVSAALVSLPAALAKGRLDGLSADLRTLRTGRPRAAAARKIAAKRPAVAWITAGVHGNEPSGSDASLRLLYDLAARTDCANERRLRNLLTVVVPVQNPDGRAADQRANSAGFDLNRDWFARTQPELSGKVALLERFPPILYVDSHEERSSSFFFPPNTDPVYHEVPPRSLTVIAKTFSPALRQAFDRRGFSYETGRTYDLFFVGYGDSAPTTAFGAAGMTFEKGTLGAYSERFAQMYAAHETALSTAASKSRALLESWAAGWREARAEGAGGKLRPNRLLSGQKPSRAVPKAPVYAYALRADGNTADVARLVERLRAFGVEVQRLNGPAKVTLRPWGAAAAAATPLPAGTYWVSMAQGPKHWIQALLNDDSYVPLRFFSDVTAWSNPLLMGLAGGTVESAALPAGLQPAGEPALGGAPDASAAAYTFPTDSTGALALAAQLLRDGVAVRRDATRAIVPGSADLAKLRAAAAKLQVPVSGLDADPGGGTTLAAPTVALLKERSADDGGATSFGWTRWVLATRLGLPVAVLTPADIAAGKLAADDVLVVPDAPGASPLSAAVLEQIKLLTARGGLFVGIRDRGVALAFAAGISTATTARPGSLLVPGAALGVIVDTEDPLGWGMAPAGFAFDENDPVLTAPAGARVVVRYPPTVQVSGYAEGLDQLGGTAAVLVDGRATLFSFDPSYRGYAEWGQRLLANAVLAPRVAISAGSRRRAVDASLQPATSPGGRPSVVRVGAGQAGALRAAAARAGVPATARLRVRGLSATLTVPNATNEPPEEHAWLNPLLAALAAEGVRPSFVMA